MWRQPITPTMKAAVGPNQIIQVPRLRNRFCKTVPSLYAAPTRNHHGMPQPRSAQHPTSSHPFWVHTVRLGVLLVVLLLLLLVLAAHSQSVTGDRLRELEIRSYQLETAAARNAQHLADLERRVNITDTGRFESRVTRLETIADINVALIIMLIVDAMVRIGIAVRKKQSQ